ncbi:MAG: hypothetical protein D6762_06750 [Candidatus Neomarinimicrobiota bacterium]|nr:MAG: hypothetical protein D6762_06750 [Candidatus Neomarinimicrobiota bacterium]
MKQVLLILSMLSLLTAQGEFVGEQLEHGSVNYADRTIRATGIGFVPQNMINAGQARRAALRIAKQDALRNLIEIVNGVTLTSETTMSGAMLDDVIRTKVEGVIRGAYQVGEPKYLSDTSVEVTYEVPMSGISEIVIPVAEPTPPAGTPAAGPVTGTETAPPVTAPSGPYTGIVLDSRGLGVRPAMAPRILDQDGDVVFGPGDYSREYAVMNGVTGYTKSLENAQKDPRVGTNPLVVKAVSASGQTKADVVVSNADAQKILQLNARQNVLQDCRVMIVLD